MNTIELIHYSLRAVGTGSGIGDFSFTLGPCDVCAIESRNPDDAHTFVRALATLTRPIHGTYRFKGQTCDFKDRTTMLRLKKRIGYVAPDAALISNLTIRQNLLLQRYYYENRLDIDLGEDALALCSALGIKDKLDQRPAGLNAMETQAAVIIRELTKPPEVMIIGHPEGFIGHAKFEVLMEIFNRLIADRLPIVLLSYDHRLIQRFANRKIIIADGSLSASTVTDPSALERDEPGPLSTKRPGHETDSLK
jgi:ABC-type lipoprotein export system ATPase subunit